MRTSPIKGRNHDRRNRCEPKAARTVPSERRTTWTTRGVGEARSPAGGTRRATARHVSPPADLFERTPPAASGESGVGRTISRRRLDQTIGAAYLVAIL